MGAQWTLAASGKAMHGAAMRRERLLTEFAWGMNVYGFKNPPEESGYALSR